MAKKVCCLIGASSKWMPTGVSAMNENGGKAITEEFNEEVRWGVGGALGLKFAAEGCLVALFSRKIANVQNLAKAIRGRGGQAICVQCELSSEESIKTAFNTVRKETRTNHIEYLVYNAGYTSQGKSEVLIEDLPIKLLDDAHHSQCRGAVLCCQQVLPEMRQNGGGAILFSSVPASIHASQKGLPNSITKAGMRGLSMAIAREYNQYGVHSVHIVLDGLIDSAGTRRFADFMNKRMDKEIAEKGYSKKGKAVMDPVALANTYYALATQDPSIWTNEIILTPSSRPVASRM